MNSAKTEPNIGSDVRNLQDHELDSVSGGVPWQFWVPGPASVPFSATGGPPYIHLFSPYTDVT